jgi:hypothetical protein
MILLLVAMAAGSWGCAPARTAVPAASTAKEQGSLSKGTDRRSRNGPAAPAAEKPPPAAAAREQPAQGPSPDPEPPAIIIRQMEIYGTITFRAGKALGMRSLVMTREQPPPAGSEGTVFRKVEVAGNPSEWIPIARVTLKKFETGGQVHFVIVEELPPAPGESGKPAAGRSNAFGKGTSIKAEMTL